MRSADNNFFQPRSTFTTDTPPRRTPPQQSTRFVRTPGGCTQLLLLSSSHTLIYLGLHPIVSRKHRFLSDFTGARNESTHHHPPKHQKAQHTHTSTKEQHFRPPRTICDYTEVADRSADQNGPRVRIFERLSQFADHLSAEAASSFDPTRQWFNGLLATRSTSRSR